MFAPQAVTEQMPTASAVDVGPLHGWGKLFWQQVRLPALVRETGPDLLHCPCYTIPLTVRCPSIVTVHDLIVWTHPWLVGWRTACHLCALMGQSVRHAAAVCVPTECVRRDVIDRYAIPAAKVFVVPWGVDTDFAPLPPGAARQRIREQFGIDEPFNLFCGCLEAKKNLPAAIQASAEAGLPLLAVGPRLPSSKIPRDDNRCHWLGFVSVADLRTLYSAATALVFPSLVEGFGLPVVEAMSCGCPVVTSTDPALTEVCGGAAIHVPPNDVSAIAAALREVAEDPTLRENLIGRGLQRAASFTWSTAVSRFEEAVDYASGSAAS